MSQKILVSSFLPRGEKSNTKKLLDIVLSRFESGSEITMHEFSTETIPYMMSEDIDTYEHRWKNPEILSAEQLERYRVFESYAEELLANDAIVIAYPIYNWWPPAPMKAWIDAVMQARKMPGAETLPQKRIICIMTGGWVPTSEYPSTLCAYSYVEEIFRKILGCENVQTHYISWVNKRSSEELAEIFNEKSKELSVTA